MLSSVRLLPLPALALAAAGCVGTITDSGARCEDDGRGCVPGADPDAGAAPADAAVPTADADLPPAIPMPAITFVIGGGLFAESDVRPEVEAGVADLLELLATHVEVDPNAVVPDITVYYSPSSNSYCSGIAYVDSTEIACPYGYPIHGDNQNFVVSITVHEIGHIVAQALIAPPSTRDNCVNEGLATWLARPLWANHASQPVGSLREAARREIAAGRARASLDGCVLASDPWYKVYGSLLEYAELEPGLIGALGRGEVSRHSVEAGWAAWLAE